METPVSQLNSDHASCRRGSAGAQTCPDVSCRPHTSCVGFTLHVPVLLAEYLPQWKKSYPDLQQDLESESEPRTARAGRGVAQPLGTLGAPCPALRPENQLTGREGVCYESCKWNEWLGGTCTCLPSGPTFRYGNWP